MVLLAVFIVLELQKIYVVCYCQTVDFYRKSGTSWAQKVTSFYAGKPSLLAAVYSENEESYECGMKNAFLRLNLVTQILIDRVGRISSGASSSCQGVYSASLQKLNSIQGLSNQLKGIAGFDNAKMNNLVLASQELSSQNFKAQQFSCPLIY